MHLYLRNDDVTTEVSEITLQDGCMPAIGGQRLELVSQDGHKIQLEPALWFKVMALDSISVDCSRRAIFWNVVSNMAVGSTHQTLGAGSATRNSDNVVMRKKSTRPQRQQQKISESMFIGGDCYGYHSDFDEIFDVGHQTLMQYTSEMITKERFNEIMIRLLHCYILPVVTFTRDNMTVLEERLQLQEALIQATDQGIMVDQDKIDAVKRAMKKQRRRFVTNLSVDDIPMPLSYPDDLVQLLQRQVGEDVADAWQKLDQLQSGVDSAKRNSHSDSMSSSSSGESLFAGAEDAAAVEDQLRDARKSRNDFFAYYHKLLQAREALREHIGIANSKIEEVQKEKKSRKSKVKTRTNPLYDTYLGLEVQIGYFLDKIQQLTDNKVLMISVKVAICSALNQLKDAEKTEGNEKSMDGARKPTDVLRHSSIPQEWLSLADQVSRILASSNHPVSRLHAGYCSGFNQTCATALKEKRMLDMSSQLSSGSSSPKINRKSVDILLSEHDMYVEEVKISNDYCPETKNSIYSEDPVIPQPVEKKNTNDEASPSILRKKASRSTFKLTSLHDLQNLEVSLIDIDINSCEMGLVHNKAASFDQIVDSDKIIPSVVKCKSSSLNELSSFSSQTTSGSSFEVVPIDLPEEEREEGVGCFPLSSKRLSGACIRTSQYPEDMHQSTSGFGSDTTASNSEPQMNVIHESVSITQSDSDNCAEEYISGRDYIKHILEHLKESIQRHFSNIIEELTEHLSFEMDSGHNYFQKLWQCYEAYFYEEVMTSISKLYKEIYLPISDSIIGCTSSLCADDLDLQDSILCHMLCDPVCAKQDNNQPMLSSSSSSQHHHPFSLPQSPVVAAGQFPVTCLRENFELQTFNADSDPAWSPTITIQLDDVSEESHPNILEAMQKTELECSSESISISPSQSSGFLNSTELPTDPSSDVKTETSDGFAKNPLVPDLDHICGSVDSGVVTLSSSFASGLTNTDARYTQVTVDCQQNENSQNKTSSTPVQGLSPRSIKLNHPTMTYVYSRRTWPVSAIQSQSHTTSIPPMIPEGMESGENYQTFPSHSSLSRMSTLLPTTNEFQAQHVTSDVVSMPTHPSKSGLEKSSLRLRAQHKLRFEEIYTCMEHAVEEQAPLVKLQHLTHCLREISAQISTLQTELFGRSLGGCADDIMDVLILVLINCKDKQFSNLYSQIMMLTDLMPPFFEGGPFCYSLVQYIAAYQFLHDKLVMKTKV